MLKHDGNLDQISEQVGITVDKLKEIREFTKRTLGPEILKLDEEL